MNRIYPFSLKSLVCKIFLKNIVNITIRSTKAIDIFRVP